MHSYTKVEINTQGAILHKDIPAGMIKVASIRDDLGQQCLLLRFFEV